jgi:hypothetical protein
MKSKHLTRDSLPDVTGINFCEMQLYPCVYESYTDDADENNNKDNKTPCSLEMTYSPMVSIFLLICLCIVPAKQTSNIIIQR